MKKLVLSVCSVLVVLLTSGYASGDHDHTKRTHHVISIDGMMVHPRTLEISTEDVVVWSNYSHYMIQVRFPADLGDKLQCAMRPNFYKAGDGALLSRPIRSLEFAMPCKLAAGEYDYSILGTQPGLSPETPTPADPKGRIIVR